ncbi:MAG TPA: sugar ABC transporter substrate-binding protein [Bacteroidales bacterium]|nr:sugar ABC transporter substrate-binding protein [Bacteroidales bacterium]
MIKVKSRFITICLFLFMVTSAMVAQKQDVSTIEKWAQGVKAKSNGKTINLLFASHPSTEAIQKMTDEFTKLTGIKTNWKIITDGTIKNVELLESTSKSGKFDVYMVDGFSIADFYNKKFIIDLSPYLQDPYLTPSWFDYEDILAGYREGISMVGKNPVTIPIAGESRFIAYRTDLFKKYDKKPPTTMDEFLELAKFFNGKEPGIYGVAMRAASGRMCGTAWMSIAYSFTDDPIVDHITLKPSFNTPGALASVKFYVDLMRQGPPDISTYTHEEAAAAFMQGKVAMWLDATALVSWMQDKNKCLVWDKIGYAPPPDGPAGSAAAIAGWGMGIPSDAKNKEEAWDFIVYMCSRAKMKEYILNGGVATRASAYLDKELAARNPSYPAELATLDKAAKLSARGVKYISPTPYILDLMGICGTYINKAIIGDITPEQACIQGQKELEDFLRDKGAL